MKCWFTNVGALKQVVSLSADSDRLQTLQVKPAWGNWPIASVAGMLYVASTRHARAVHVDPGKSERLCSVCSS